MNRLGSSRPRRVKPQSCENPCNRSATGPGGWSRILRRSGAVSRRRPRRGAKRAHGTHRRRSAAGEGREQGGGAARGDVEGQAGLAAKASDESAQLKQAAESGSAELRKSLQQERERAERLAQDLAAARRDVETQTALAAKASAEATRPKQAESAAAGTRKAPQQQCARAMPRPQHLSPAPLADGMPPAAA